jgi:hypothetical protein
MERHSRLPGSRTAPYQGHPRSGGADRLILLPLDGRNDVTHSPAGRPSEGRQQSAVPNHRHTGGGSVRVE